MRNIGFMIMTILLTGCEPKNTSLDLQWLPSAKLPMQEEKAHLGLAGPVTGILQDKLLIAGGANFPNGMPWEGGKKNYHNSMYLYDIVGKELLFKEEIALDREIAYAANVVIDDKLYSAGGEDSTGAIKNFQAYSISVNKELKIEVLAELPQALTNAGLVHLSDNLYVVGGENAELVSDKIYSYQIGQDSKGWQEFLTLPYPVSNAVVLADGIEKIYVVGGRKKNANAKSDIYDQVLEVNMDSKEIKVISRLAKPMAAGTGVFYKNHLLLFSGDDARTFHQVEQAIANINLNSDPSKKDSLITAKNNLLVNHPGFERQALALNLRDLTWKTLAALPSAGTVTTTALLHKDLLIIPTGEIKAGVRTDQILLGQLN